MDLHHFLLWRAAVKPMRCASAMVDAGLVDCIFSATDYWVIGYRLASSGVVVEMVVEA